MNSVRICWSRRSSETSSMTSQAPPDDDRLRPDEQPPAVGLGAPDLACRRALVHRRLCDCLDLDVEEGLDQGPTDERAGWAAKERVRRRCWRPRSGAVGRPKPRPGRAPRSGGRDRGVGGQVRLERVVLRAERGDGVDRVGAGRYPGDARTLDDRPDAYGSPRPGRAPATARLRPAMLPQREHRTGTIRLVPTRWSAGRGTLDCGAARSSARKRGRHGRGERGEDRRRERVTKDQEVREPGGRPARPVRAAASVGRGWPRRHHARRGPMRRAAPHRHRAKCRAATDRRRADPRAPCPASALTPTRPDREPGDKRPDASPFGP